MLPVFLMNFLFAISTTVGMTFIPLLVTDSLGMSLLVLGLIEGVSELASNVLRLITGNVFDRARDHRLLFVTPALLALIAKIILSFPSAWTIITSKVTERIANGAFAAPRDAYVGENSKNKGLALGFLSSAKTFGCVLGPVIVSGSTLLIGPLQENIMTIIFLACFINFLGLTISFFVNTKKKIIISQSVAFNMRELKETCKNLRFLFILSLLFFFGRFNDGVIMLCLKSNGFPEWFYLATISFFNFVMLLISPIMGYQIDRKREYQILFVTIIALLVFNIFFLQLDNFGWISACLGIVCWGIQRAGAQITFSAMVFRRTPVKFYGTAIGIYSLITGIGFFISSSLCGYLAQTSYNLAFTFSGTFAFLALILALYMYRTDKSQIMSPASI